MDAPSMQCADCGAPLVLRAGRYGPFYGCTRFPECLGGHGAHADGSPMGIPADQRTREARRLAHQAFDQLWQGGGMTRPQAYRWLQKRLGLSRRRCHIARFDDVTCRRVVALVDSWLGRRRRHTRKILPAQERSA